MALRFVDSFDHYPTALLTRKWGTVDGSPTISALGRRGTSCFRIPIASYGATKNFDAHATWIVGFAFRVLALPNSSQPVQVLKIQDGTAAQVDLRLNLDGTWSVTRNGAVLSTSSYVMPVNVYVYVEFRVTINDTTGSYELRVNGANITSGSNVDTKNTANATANRIVLGTSSNSGGSYEAHYEDLYVCDGSGSSNNNFLGDCRVDCYLPNGNGFSSQLVGSDGNSVDNYQLVDEASANSDTDYVESSVVGNQDTYTFADMTHNPTNIYGVQINVMARKSDAGLRSIQSVTRSGGANTDGSARPLSSDYFDEIEMRETDPNTSAAWTIGGFNSAEFGAKVAA